MGKVFQVQLMQEHTSQTIFPQLDLPAQPWELLDAMDRVRLQEGEKLRVRIDQYLDFKELIFHLITAKVQLLELNDLALRLARLDAAQRTAFRGLLRIESPTFEQRLPLARLRDLAASVDCCRVEVSVSRDEELGRIYVESGRLPEYRGLPESVRKVLNYGEIGKESREREQGLYISGGGYVVRTRSMIQAPPAPERLEKPPYSFRLCVTNERLPNRTALLDLPASPEELDKALRETGAASWRDVGFQTVDSALPGFLEGMDCAGEIEILNDLALTVRDVERAGLLPKYKAVLHAVRCTDLEEAIRLGNRLDEYLLETRTYTSADIALGELHTVLDDRTVELLKPCVDLYRFGDALIQKYGSDLTEYGLVERRDGQPVQKMGQEPQPDRQKIQRGGMTLG